MFHFVNCTSSPEPEAESSADSFAAMSLCAPSSWRNTLGASSSNASETASCPGSPSGMTFAPSTATPGEAESMSCAGASPARTSAPRAKGQASTGSAAGSGLNLLGSLARFDPDTSSWRTPQCSLIEDLDVFSETWPRWGSMRNGACWARMTLAPPTSENESGFWRTPTVGCVNQDRSIDPAYAERLHAKGQTISLAAQVKNSKFWPTPRAADGAHLGANPTPTTLRRKEAGQANLSEFVLETTRTFPTPCARDYRSPNKLPFSERGGGRKGEQLVNFVKFTTPCADDTGHRKGKYAQGGDPLSHQAGGQLNPPWVEWLMGWPEGWTDLKPLATAKFQRWLASHGKPSCAA